MSRPDEHPEEWLDSAAAGALSLADRRELDLHLAECPACSAQLTASRAARQRRATDSERRRDRLAVERALARTAHRRARPARRSRGMWVRFGVTAVVLASAASAGVWAARGWNFRLFASETAHLAGPPGIDAPISRTLHPAPLASEAAISEPTPPESVPFPATDLAAETAPQSKAPPAVHRRAPEKEKQTPADLLEQARDLRRGGDLDGAAGVYRKLERTYPLTPEARLAYALLGRLLLENGSADQALAQFDHYLTSQGPLAEDALAGRAGALARLGHHADEAAAWKTLLSRFPQSVYAARARSRIRELGSGSDRATP
jgi:TolA-binding protein